MPWKLGNYNMCNMSHMCTDIFGHGTGCNVAEMAKFLNSYLLLQIDFQLWCDLKTTTEAEYFLIEFVIFLIVPYNSPLFVFL